MVYLSMCSALKHLTTAHLREPVNLPIAQIWNRVYYFNMNIHVHELKLGSIIVTSAEGKVQLCQKSDGIHLWRKWLTSKADEQHL